MRHQTLLAAVLLGTSLSLAACNDDASPPGGGALVAQEALVAAAPGAAERLVSAAPVSKALPGGSDEVRDVAAAKRQEGRRMEEKHAFEFRGPNAGIEEAFAMAATGCVAPTCEVVSSSIDRTNAQTTGRFVAQIEPERLSSFVSGVTGKDVKLISHAVTTRDRTAEYIDIEGRAAAQVALRDRLLAMVRENQWAKVSELLEVEQELARVQGEIEAMSRQMRAITSVTDRATIEMRFVGEAEFRPSVRRSPLTGALNKVGEVFAENLAAAILAVATAVPWLVALGVGYAVLRFVLRARPALSFRRRDEGGRK